MTVLFTIHKNLAEILNFFEPCFLICIRRKAVVHTYKVDEGMK